MELQELHIPFEREWAFHPTYRGKPMSTSYRLDFVCKGNIIVECKSVETLTDLHHAQLYNYMRLTQMPYGILVNFATKSVAPERYCYDAETKTILNLNGQRIARMDAPFR